jgi:rhodanese-related sulfurtransferase
MKKFWISIAVALGLICIIVLFGSNSSSVYRVSLKQINDNMQNGALLIDVRTPEEYMDGHAIDATNLPLKDIQNGETPNIAKDKVIYVYCQSGKRAATAKTILEQTGYKYVISVISLDNWVALGGRTTNPTCQDATDGQC